MIELIYSKLLIGFRIWIKVVSIMKGRVLTEFDINKSAMEDKLLIEF